MWDNSSRPQDRPQLSHGRARLFAAALWHGSRCGDLPGTVTSVGPEGKSEGLDQVTIRTPPGLGQQENLQLLGEGIGLELELESQEKEAGPFRADILCKDTASDDWVLIENQLARTDHSHLGQLLTYAAGVEGATRGVSRLPGLCDSMEKPR